jgi:hypothetical protein
MKTGLPFIVIARELLSTSFIQVLGPIQWVPGDFPPWVKRPGHEADHSLPKCTAVKNKWIYTSTLPYVFMV